MKTRERIYIFLVIFSLLSVLLCCPVGAQETVPEIGMTLEDEAALPESAEDATDAVLLTAAADTAVTATPAGEEAFAGNAIGQWLDKTFYKLDYAVFTAFSKIQNGVLTPIVNIVTYFGDSAIVIPLLLVGLVLCLFKKTRRYGIVLAGAIVLGTLMTNVVLKNVCGRVRPYVTMADDPNFYLWYTRAGANVESDNSFPSGHTTAAFEIATALFLTVKN